MIGVALWEQAQGVSSREAAGGVGAGAPRVQHAEREGAWGAQRGRGCLGEVGGHGAEGSVKIHRCRHGWASPERQKEDRATRRHCNLKAELSPEKTLLFVWPLCPQTTMPSCRLSFEWKLGAGYRVTWHGRASHRTRKEKEVQHNPDRRRERR